MNEVLKIKKIISNITYGIKTKKGIRPSANKNSLKNGFKKPITNKLIINHINNIDTVYYYGSEKQNETLVMIDIDVNKKNKKGSTAGAISFAKHINKNLFKTFSEPSTSGEGIHSYFVLNKQNYCAKEVNKILKNFQNFLQNQAKEINADIELVEVKGTLFEIEYKNKKIENIKYGMLGKIPRNIKGLLELNNNIKIEDIKNNFNLENFKIKKNGSISEKHFNKEELSKLSDYEKVAEKLIEQNIKAGKFAVTVRDAAIALMFLKFLKENKNKDETLPTKRIEKLWRAVHRCKDIDRGWNHHRWKVIRDILSKKGLIQWIDNRYQIGTEQKEGIACKWEISQKLYMYLKNCEKKEGSSLMDTKPSSDGRKTTTLLENIKSFVLFEEKSSTLTELIAKINDILFEYNHKIPILSLINNENNDLFYNKAYGYIKNEFCVA